MSSSKIMYLGSAGLGRWLESLPGEYNVFVPVETGSQNDAAPDFSFRRLCVPPAFIFNPYRPSDPLKAFFTPYIEKVAGYFGADVDMKQEKPTVVFGVKACDLAAHRVQDYVFLQGVDEDPFYRARRDGIVIISGDCTDFKEVCFCRAMGGMPYAEDGFDLNMSPLDDGFLVECGSRKGEELLERARDCFTDAAGEQVERRDRARRELTERLDAHLEPRGLPACEGLQALVKAGMEKDTWDRFARTCVECGGCNFICDTCHCFLLSDRKAGSQNEKIRLWDSCQYKNFATVAGGATPMSTRSERLRNRFLKKFDFFVENMKEPACCGCGRCIEVCPGEIDIREVLEDLKISQEQA